MRQSIYKTAFAISLLSSLLFSCKESGVTKEEQQEKDKVGDVYNSDEQGVDIENRDNQFNTSRNDNTEGYGQETGAPSDTIDNDGDKKVNNTQTRQ